MNSYKVLNTRCDWVYNSSEGSVSSPDNFLPPMTSCTYTFPLRVGHYLEVILTIYGLEWVYVNCLCIFASVKTEHLPDTKFKIIVNGTSTSEIHQIKMLGQDQIIKKAH